MENLDVSGVILNWTLKNNREGCGLDSSGLRQGLVLESCDHGNEISGSKKYGEFIEQLVSQEGLTL